jgi:hypothetical protein
VIDYFLHGFTYTLQALLIASVVLATVQAVKEVIDERSTAGK